MTKKNQKTSLRDYMVAGAKFKLIDELIRMLEYELPKILDGRTASASEKAMFKTRNHIKCCAEDNMFEAYDELGDDFMHVFYGDLYDHYTYGHEAYYTDVEQEIRDIALDVISSLVVRAYGTQAFDEMKRRSEINGSFKKGYADNFAKREANR